MNFGSLFSFFILLVATISVASSADLPKIKRGCTTNIARTELSNTPCTPFVFNGEEYNDGCADYYGRYLWCSTGESWTYCGPCLDDVAKEEEVAKVTTPVAKESTEVAKENTEVAKENTEVAKENTEVAKESTEVAKESTEVAKESTEVAKENQGSDEKTETKEDTSPKITATDSVPAASTTEKTENKPVEVEEPAHDEKEPENVAENKENEENENKDEKTADVPAEAATEEPKVTAEDKATKTAENPETKTTEPAKEPATEEGKDNKETKADPKNVETPAKEPEVTAQTPEKEATIQTNVAPKNPNKEVEPEVVAPKKPSVATATSECDDEDDCAEGNASGAEQPDKTEDKATEDTPKLVVTKEGATVEEATKETKVKDNTNGGEKNEVKEIVEVDVNFEIEEEEPIIVQGENKGDKKNNQGVSNVFKITIIVCVVFLLTGIVITGIIVKKRLHRDEYLAGREEKGLKIDLDGVKANSHEKITSVDNVA